MKIVQDVGYVEFRFPNISEMMILLGEIGLSSVKKESSFEVNDDFVYLGRLILKMKPLITKLELKTTDGVLVENYEEALNHFEFMAILTEVASELFKAMDVSQKKRLNT